MMAQMNLVLLDDTLPLTMMLPVDKETGRYRHDLFLQRQEAARRYQECEDNLERVALEEEDRLWRENNPVKELPYLAGKVKVRHEKRWEVAWTMHSALWEKLAPHQREGAIVIGHIRTDRMRQDAREQMLSQEAE